MKKRINITVIVDKMQTTVQHLVLLCPRKTLFTLLLAVANSSLFTLHSSLLISCSSDDTAEPKTEKSTEVQLMSYVAGFEEPTRTNRASDGYGTTRAWTPPSGYSPYQLDNDQSISVFFTQASTPGEERFFFTSAGKWKVSGDELTAGTYYLYGYVPYDKSITSTVNKLDGSLSFADGAVLTMTNVPTVSPADICVLVAAKNGKADYKADADYSVTGLQPGDFQYVAPEGSGNYIYLLFDHLFSALRVKMRVQGDYADLRTIKLKGLRLQACVGSEPTKKKTNITVTLNKTTDGTSPISNDVNDVVFTPTGTEVSDGGVIVESEQGIELTKDYQPFQSHFMPAGVTKLNIISTYDVYDRKGNLIRLNDEAINTIDIQELFSGQTKALRGRRYTVNLTINPTYLYMLSDPDLDNPTVIIDN